MTMHPRLFVGLFDDRDTRVLGEAFALACDMLDANGDMATDRAIRAEIAAALLEAAGDEILDAAALARAAVDLVYVDEIEVDFT